jgi:hypothetical protein
MRMGENVRTSAHCKTIEALGGMNRPLRHEISPRRFKFLKREARPMPAKTALLTGTSGMPA